MILTKAQALKVSQRKFVNVYIPELDGDLRLASLPAGAALAANALQARMNKGEDVGQQLMQLLMEVAIVDEKGDPLFEAAEAKEFLARISVDTLTLISNSVPMQATPTAVIPGNSAPSQPVA